MLSIETKELKISDKLKINLIMIWRIDDAIRHNFN